uniref:Uncharacterized protein n=1 Tax=Aegilops tauschii subsp. strangulata TaxID=200361 RepID=A0A453QLS5_AEGTS
MRACNSSSGAPPSAATACTDGDPATELLSNKEDPLAQTSC